MSRPKGYYQNVLIDGGRISRFRGASHLFHNTLPTKSEGWIQFCAENCTEAWISTSWSAAWAKPLNKYFLRHTKVGAVIVVL